jgi:hypothetical protein
VENKLQTAYVDAKNAVYVFKMLLSDLKGHLELALVTLTYVYVLANRPDLRLTVKRMSLHFYSVKPFRIVSCWACSITLE